MNRRRAATSPQLNWRSVRSASRSCPLPMSEPTTTSATLSRHATDWIAGLVVTAGWQSPASFSPWPGVRGVVGGPRSCRADDRPLQQGLSDQWQAFMGHLDGVCVSPTRRHRCGAARPLRAPRPSRARGGPLAAAGRTTYERWVTVVVQSGSSNRTTLPGCTGAFTAPTATHGSLKIRSNVFGVTTSCASSSSAVWSGTW